MGNVNLGELADNMPQGLPKRPNMPRHSLYQMLGFSPEQVSFLQNRGSSAPAEEQPNVAEGTGFQFGQAPVQAGLSADRFQRPMRSVFQR